MTAMMERERKRFGLSKTTGMAALALHIRKYESSHIEIQKKNSL
jgi:hypothetical protein